MESLVEQITPLGDKDSEVIKDSALALFSKPKVDSNILSNDYVTFDQASPQKETDSVFNFHLPASMMPRYCDLKSLMVCAKVCIIKKDADGNATSVTQADNVSPPNFLLAALFKSMTMKINGGVVYTSAECQPTINVLSRILGGSQESFTTYAHLEGGGKLWDPSVGLSSNVGHYANVAKYVTELAGPKPKEVWLMGSLNHSFESSNSILANNAAIDIQLVREDDKKLLTVGPTTATDTDWTLGNRTYHLRIKSLSLHVKMPLITDKLFASIENRFKRNEAERIYYYHDKSVLQSIPTGVTSWVSQDLALSKPLKVFCVFLNNDRVQGSYTTSSYFFEQPEHLKQARFLLDGKDVSSLDVIQFPDLDDGGYEHWYRKLFETTQSLNIPTPPNISFAAFKKYLFVLSYDNSTAGHTDGHRLPLLRMGSLRLHLTFSKPTEKTINMIAWTTSVGLMKFRPGEVPMVSEN